MRRIVLTLIASLIVIGASTSAMSYEQARVQALFLTDKMAYELNLTEAQYEAAYEINLDYLMNVNTVDDLYGMYWSHRNVDLSYILYDWQYRAYVEAAYFYRPLNGMQATGDLAFMLVIHAATIITSDDHRSTTFTTEPTAGE